jgi:uncharacterized membrane protein
MFVLIGLLLFGLFVASLVLPWIHLTYIRDLRKEVHRLTLQVAWLIAYAREKGAEIPEQWQKLSDTSLLKKEGDSLSKDKQTEKAPKTPPIPAASPPQPKAPIREFKQPTLKQKVSFKSFKDVLEQKFAMSLPIWIGGVALALSGAFLVKYSIEMGFLSPSVRLVIGGLFGISLLLFGNWIHGRTHIANGERISQALSGAGIADLYVCLFAATSFYHLIPPLFGFIGMAAVTAVAVVLSLKQGPPIAMLGMIGGFLTPALIGLREPNAPMLFIYLYFVVAGLFTVIRQKNWWFIAIPVVLAEYAWVIFWLENSFSPHDGVWLGFFLIAVSGTIVFYSKKAMEEYEIKKSGTFTLFPYLNYLSMGGAILLMSAITVKSNFSEMEWGLFGCLAAGGIVLSYYNQKIYGFIPWVSVVMNVIMLLGWHEPNPAVLGSTLLGFAFLYTFSSYWLMWKAQNPRPWAILAAGSSFIYYVFAYAKFHNWMEDAVHMAQAWYAADYLWGFFSLGLFILSVCAVIQILNQFKDTEDTKQYLLTVFTLTATAFLSIGLALELTTGFLTIALSVEILAVSWINRHVTIKVLRPITGILAILFGILLVPQILVQIFLLSISQKTDVLYYFYAQTDVLSYLQSKIPSVKWSLFHLGLPALMFGLSSFWLRQQKDDRLIRAFEMIGIGLVAVLSYYLTRHAFHINESLLFAKSTFIERGMFTNILFLYGLACLWLGRIYDRKAILLSGGLLIGFALMRILVFDLLLYNPLWSHQQVGAFPLFNALLLPYGFPMLWLILVNKELIKNKDQKYIYYTNVFLFALLFFFINFNVRQFYHGQYLDHAITSNAEVYTYSAVWLLTGIGLLFFGTLKQNKILRVASLAFVMLTVAKVFLYDAAELTGLFRVFSFLGLGISLLGLSWFYTRFVFKRVP